MDRALGSQMKGKVQCGWKGFGGEAIQESGADAHEGHPGISSQAFAADPGNQVRTLRDRKAANRAHRVEAQSQPSR